MGRQVGRAFTGGLGEVRAGWMGREGRLGMVLTRVQGHRWPWTEEPRGARPREGLQGWLKPVSMAAASLAFPRNTTVLNSKVISVTVKPPPRSLLTPLEIEFAHMYNVSFLRMRSALHMPVCVRVCAAASSSDPVWTFHTGSQTVRPHCLTTALPRCSHLCITEGKPRLGEGP